jgi:hypothetical protein
MRPDKIATNSTDEHPTSQGHDLRDGGAEIWPGWDLSTPGVREMRDAGDLSPFHGWETRTPSAA